MNQIQAFTADASEALTHPDLARAGAKRGAGLRVQAPGQAPKVARMGALDGSRRKRVATASRPKRSAGFMAFRATLDHLYGPRPGTGAAPVVIVRDNGPIHVSKAALAARAARARWLTVAWLPKCTPERNAIEGVWHDLKAFHLAPKTLTDAGSLDAAIHPAVAASNAERTRDLLDEQRISA